MTADELVQTLAGDRSPPTLAQVLGLVDRVVGEAGRRRHMFGWLRVPGGRADEWLVVDAYYPSNRLVVLWRAETGPHDQLCSEQIPAHGLRLLELSPTEVGSDPVATETVIERKLGLLGPAPRRHVEPVWTDGPTAVSRAMASFAPPAPTPASPRRMAPAQGAAAERAARFGFSVTLVLAAALIVEVYVGVDRLGIGNGQPLLAFGLALDVCSRALGAIAASRAGQQAWALWCALGGSPFVANFALFRQTGPVEVEPAPLAGVIALIACVVVALGIAVAALGG